MKTKALKRTSASAYCEMSERYDRNTVEPVEAARYEDQHNV